MKNRYFRPLALVAATSLGLAAGTAASAAPYTAVDPQASIVSFSYSQMNVKMDGSFSELKAPEFIFDPENPEDAKVRLELVLNSIDAGYEEANSELQKEEWLALSQHPVATFVSRDVKALGDDRYQVTGDLSIKGNTQEVTAPFEFQENGDTASFKGTFALQRADFGIGEGQWQDFSIVANEIEVSFDVVAKQR